MNHWFWADATGIAVWLGTGHDFFHYYFASVNVSSFIIRAMSSCASVKCPVYLSEINHLF